MVTPPAALSPTATFESNEFLKEHWTVQAQQKEIDGLKVELREQRAFIQAVNDEVELHRSVPQTVLNHQ